jgi:hypothetical protein
VVAEKAREFDRCVAECMRANAHGKRYVKKRTYENVLHGFFSLKKDCSDCIQRRQAVFYRMLLQKNQLPAQRSCESCVSFLKILSPTCFKIAGLNYTS